MSYFKQYETDSNKIELKEVQTSPPPKETNSNNITVSPGELLIISIGLAVTAWGLNYCRRLWSRKTANEESNSSKVYPQTPCANCRYFQNNLYLKCAVQPSLVLSKEAVDCPDYQPKEDSKESQ